MTGTKFLATLAAFGLISSLCPARLLAAQPDQTGSNVSSDTRMTATQPESVEESTASFPLGVQAYSFVYGPMLGSPTSGEVPTTWMDQVSGVSVQNQIGLRYDLSDNVQLTPTFDFEVLVSDPNQIYGSQYLALTYDSFIKLNVSSLSDFSLGESKGWVSGDVRYYAPTSEYSRENNSLGSVRFTVTPNVQLAHSNFSLALVNFARYYVQRQDTETYNRYNTLPRLMLYTAPLLSYSLGDKLALWSLLEMSTTFDTRWQKNNADPDRALVDFEPGLDVHVGSHVIISPYLNWFIRQPIDSTSINLTASLNI